MVTKTARTLIKIGFLVVLAGMVANCSSSAKVTFTPEVKKVKTVAVISAYSRTAITNMEKGGPLAGITTVATMTGTSVANDVDLQVLQGAVVSRLTAKLSAQTSLKFKPVSEYGDSPAMKNLASGADQVTEMDTGLKGIRALDTWYKPLPYVNSALLSECVKPMFGSNEDCVKERNALMGHISTAAKALNVDAVMVVSMYFNYKPGGMLSSMVGSGTAKGAVMIVPIIVSADGKLVMSYGGGQAEWTESDKTVALAAGGVLLNKDTEAALMQAAQRATDDMFEMMKKAL